VVVISQRLWTVAYGSDPEVIGRTLRLNGLPATVVGVMQPAFTGPQTTHPAVWAPLGAMDDLGAGTPVTPTSGPSVEVVGRLRPGVSRQVAQDSLSALLSQSIVPGSARRTDAPQTVQVSRAAAPIDMAFGDDYAGLAIVFTLVGLVLVLACTNTANLLMASAVTRMREVGIRLAMGATRRRLVTQLITESLMLGIIAGVFGLLLADWLVPVIGRLVDVPPDIDLTPDGRVAAFASVVGLLCGAAAGLSPARFGSRGNVLAALKGDAAPADGTIVPSRFRLSFVGLQATVSMLLLVLAALLTRSAVRMTSLDVGFDADRVLGVALEAPRRDFDEAAYLSSAAAALRAIPSVQAVSVVQDVPFGCCRERDRFSGGGRTYELDVIRGDAEFFRTTGVRILQGRPFSTDEVRREAPVALISASVARVFFNGRDPLGSVLADVPSAYIRQQPATIIGVVADGLLTRVGGEEFGAIYRPLVHRANPPGFLVRTAAPGAVAPVIDQALRRVDPRVRATTTRLRDGVESYLDAKRRLAWILGPVAVLALTLAALGTYGVTAFATSQRLEEVSVRMALGASSSDVFRLLAMQGLRPVVLGLLVGLGAALIVGRVAAQELVGVSPHDPVAVGGALAVLLACAAIAVVVPARRAARSDPAALLRRT
jgi:predicted permease